MTSESKAYILSSSGFLPRADPEPRIWVHIIYLGGDCRRAVRQGREVSKGAMMSRLLLWAAGAQSYWGDRGLRISIRQLLGTCLPQAASTAGEALWHSHKCLWQELEARGPNEAEGYGQGSGSTCCGFCTVRELQELSCLALSTFCLPDS